MKQNVGTIDRIARIIVGLVLLVLGFINESLWGLVGLVPLMTAVIGWCPLYCPLKINTTCNKDCDL